MRHSLGIVLFLIVGSASAAPVTWTITNAVFDDGAVLTGQFDYDADSGLYSNISINTSAGSVFPDPVFYDTEGIWNPTTLTLAEGGGPGAPLPGERVLGLNFASALPASGGSLAFSAEEIIISGVGSRNILSGATVNAVPVPAAFWLLASALGLLRWMKRK